MQTKTQVCSNFNAYLKCPFGIEFSILEFRETPYNNYLKDLREKVLHIIGGHIHIMFCTFMYAEMKGALPLVNKYVL